MDQKNGENLDEESACVRAACVCVCKCVSGECVGVSVRGRGMKRVSERKIVCVSACVKKI